MALAFILSLIISIPPGFCGYALTFSLLPPGGITKPVLGFLNAAGWAFLVVFSYYCFFELLRFAWQFPRRKSLEEFDRLVRRGKEILDQAGR